MRKERGITLIALVITIIVMLILVGIVISLTIGENGIIRKAQESGIAYNEAEARQKLELVLLDMQADKVTNEEYNENEYLTNEIEKNGMEIDLSNPNIIRVNGWKFEIDRTIPEIVASIGKGQLNEQIEIITSATISGDYVKANIHAQINYTGEITSITIQGQTIEVPTPVNHVYIFDKEIMENGKYTILVKDKEGNYKTANITITDITEDMDIWNKADLENFRDKVNEGRTFEGKNVKLMVDIDLQGSSTSHWTPIGNYGSNQKLIFLGTFDGNNHVISNMYINSRQQFQGLFGLNKGTIKNLKIKNSQINGTGSVGAICAYNHGGTLENCVSEQNIIKGSNSGVGGVAGANFNGGYITKCYNTSTVSSTYDETGGIVGFNYGTISECYNTGTIESTRPTVAGIAGGHYYKILNCYNTGTIKSTNTIDAVGGIAGFMTVNQYTPTDVSRAIIQNCYNVGTISTTAKRGGIIGTVQSSTVSTTINNYWLNTCGADYGNSGWSLNNTGSTPKTATEMKTLAETLGNSFKQDSDNINEGYPILNWQM